MLWHHCDVSACHTGALKLAWIGGFGLSVLSPNLFLFIYLSSLLVFFLYACFFPWISSQNSFLLSPDTKLCFGKDTFVLQWFFSFSFLNNPLIIPADSSQTSRSI